MEDGAHEHPEHHPHGHHLRVAHVRSGFAATEETGSAREGVEEPARLLRIAATVQALLYRVWTTANIYTVVYDNSYIGYACGFNTQGDGLVKLEAAGQPGWHFIDLYPAIYKGAETAGRNNFRIPQRTYADDHPGEDLPAFRFAFRIDN